jgi:hypothetical protein
MLHKNSTGHSPFQTSMKANLTHCRSVDRRVMATSDPLDQFLNASTLTLPSPHAAAGLICEDGCSLFRRPHVVIAIFTRTNCAQMTIIKSSCSLSGHCCAIPCRAPDVAEPTCLASKGQRPNLMIPASPLSTILRIDCRARVKPLLIAIRTASRRNSSVYLVAIPYLLHSKRCSKETGTKP